MSSESAEMSGQLFVNADVIHFESCWKRCPLIGWTRPVPAHGQIHQQIHFGIRNRFL